MEVVHALTGEVLPDDLDTLVKAEATVDRYLRSLFPHYAFRRRLRERIAELRGDPLLPRHRFRTDKQQRVAECPRCGDRTRHLEAAGADENPFTDAEENAA